VAQRARLAAFGDKVAWADALPPAIQGVVLGNEVLDAMPVKLLRWDGQAWCERGVMVLPDIGFGWADRPTALRPPADHGFVPDTVIELHEQAPPSSSTTGFRRPSTTTRSAAAARSSPTGLTALKPMTMRRCAIPAKRISAPMWISPVSRWPRRMPGSA
jgi:Putative S-adenosyl-L-methionine-dependent methyltransferase